MISLTSDFESDSFQSDLSKSGRTVTEDNTKTDVDQWKKLLDLQGEKLNQLTNNNRELINVQSQLARLRSELEKSEMLRQTLEYELTILRAQHGKQTAFTQQLQQQFDKINEEKSKIECQFKEFQQEKQRILNDKTKQIEELQLETENLHEREKRIEILNEQIHKMERTFSDSETISRKNLAQSILAKEKQVEYEKEIELIQMKLDFTEKSLEQERIISNEAKLNVQLLNNKICDLDLTNQSLKKTNLNQQRKIDEFERQISNEKLLRSTISKLQSDLETKCGETQKLIIEYEKQMKTNREELSNFRRKYRNNEDKYHLIVNKIVEILRSTKIINEINSNENHFIPTIKQIEEFKIYLEQLKSNKIDLNNEVNRLKKSLERLSKNQFNQKQVEQDFEINKEKLFTEIEQFKLNEIEMKEKFHSIEEERNKLLKQVQHQSQSIQTNRNNLKRLITKLSNSIEIERENSPIENDWIIIDKQIQILINKSTILEEKLIERDRGTLHLTQKLEEQVLHLKEDFDQKHHLSLIQKDQLIHLHLQQIQTLNQQIQKLENRIHQHEQKSIEENQTKQIFQQGKQRLIEINKILFSFLLPFINRAKLSEQIQRLFNNQIDIYIKLIRLIHRKQSKQRSNQRFRILTIKIISINRFRRIRRSFQYRSISSGQIVYDKITYETFDKFLFLESIDFDNPLNSIGQFIQKFQSNTNRTLNFNKSSNKLVDEIQRILTRLDNSEIRLKEKEKENEFIRQRLDKIEKENEERVDYNQFERICDELQRALNREKQAQDLLNEQNDQLKSLTDRIHQNQQDKQFLQSQFDQLVNNNKYSQEKIHQYKKSHQQMEENQKRAEKAIRLVVNDKEQISLFCQRINSALDQSDKVQLENIFQFLTQLESLIKLPSTVRCSTPSKNLIEQDENPYSNELILSQNMAKGFIRLLNRFKDQIEIDQRDIQLLKDHSQMLTEQIRQQSIEDQTSSRIDSTTQSTVLIQSRPIRLDLHHRSSAFKPIKHDFNQDS